MHKHIPYVILVQIPEWTCGLVLLQLKHTEVTQYVGTSDICFDTKAVKEEPI